jgi:hypothetical protein
MTVPVWVLITGIVGSGSMAIAVQPVSDEKIHIQDTTGKIQTNVPVGASRAFSPLPIQWSDAFDGAMVAAGDDGILIASDVVSKQKMVVNFAGDVATRGCFYVWVDNLSEDDQIFMLRAGAPSHMIIDITTPETCGDLSPPGNEIVEVDGLVGHNEWLLHTDNTPGFPNTYEQNVIAIIVEMTDAGFYPVVLELERVG